MFCMSPLATTSKNLQQIQTWSTPLEKGNERKGKGTTEQPEGSKTAWGSVRLPTITWTCKLKFPTKRQGMPGWDLKKARPNYIWVAYRRFTSALRTHIYSKWRDGKRYSKQGKTRRPGVTILKSDKTEAKNGKRQRGRSIHQEAITTINIYMPPTWEHC